MKAILILLFAVLATISVAQDSNDPCDNNKYLDYLEKFGKSLQQNPARVNQKKQKWCSKIKEVELINSQNLGYTLAINQFSDLLEDELKKILSANINSLSDNIKVGTVPKISSSGSLRVGSGNSTASPPNWRTAKKVSKIKNQGSCGSCWAFASTGLYQSYMMVKGKRQFDLSEEFVVECTSQLVNTSTTSSCQEGVMSDALQLIQSYGIPKQSTYPYISGDYGNSAGYNSTAGICYVGNSSIFIKYQDLPGVVNATNLTKYENISNDDMRALLQGAPIAAHIYASSEFMSYKSGVFTGCPNFENAYASINHAVVIVGMDSDGNYIVKNSWGTAWGDSGYGIVSKDNDCALSGLIYQYTYGYQLIGSGLLILLVILGLMF